MSDVIQRVGKHRQKNGDTARIVAIEDGWAFGFDSTGEATTWKCSDGSWLNDETRLFCDLDITGPWIPDPPKPPEGFELSDRLLTVGDKLYCAGHWSCGQVGVNYVWIGYTAADLDRHFPNAAPHYIASPIPKPFRISDHGCGVYETRDGREATVPSRFDKTIWNVDGLVECGSCFDSGSSWNDGKQRPCDLVRYLRPLDPPKPDVDPGEGWRLLADEEVITDRDEFCFLPTRGTAWARCSTWQCNETPKSLLEKQNQTNAIYRRRIEPKPEWTCTGELRWKLSSGDEVGCVQLLERTTNRQWNFYIAEQRWTNGTDSEWRPVPVTTAGE